MAEKDGRLKALRKRRGLSQEALARKVGCSRQTIDNIERGSQPRIALALALAKALQASPGSIW